MATSSENDFYGFGRTLVNATDSIEKKQRINKSNERREKAELEKYGTGSLERHRKKKEEELKEMQIYYNNLKNKSMGAPHQPANFGLSGFRKSRSVFGIPKRKSSPKYGTPVDLGGGRKRKTHKKQRLSRKVKKTYRKRR